MGKKKESHISNDQEEYIDLDLSDLEKITSKESTKDTFEIYQNEFYIYDDIVMTVIIIFFYS